MRKTATSTADFLQDQRTKRNLKRKRRKQGRYGGAFGKTPTSTGGFVERQPFPILYNRNEDASSAVVSAKTSTPKKPGLFRKFINFFSLGRKGA